VFTTVGKVVINSRIFCGTVIDTLTRGAVVDVKTSACGTGIDEATNGTVKVIAMSV